MSGSRPLGTSGNERITGNQKPRGWKTSTPVEFDRSLRRRKKARAIETELLAIRRRAEERRRDEGRSLRQDVHRPALGLDSLRITVDPTGSPIPVYRLDSLSDAELELLGRMSAKMLGGPDE